MTRVGQLVPWVIFVPILPTLSTRWRCIRRFGKLIRVGRSATEAERLAAKHKLTTRADLLANKVDFATAGRTVSQCLLSARSGDVGTFTRKCMDLDEAFVQAAFALKVDELSAVVATNFGLHLIKVTERNADTPLNFA
jgi:parvulin-like peptidyl-prolyl isomerase